MRIFPLIAVLALTSACTPGGYHLAKTVPLPGEGGWDYVAVDEKVRHVYVSHTSQIEVLSADSGEPIGKIDDLHGVHGIALAPDLGRGFITNGKSDEVTVFDTTGVIKRIHVGKKPDAITYDAVTRRVFAMNGESNSASVIDAKSLKKIGSINLGGAPEFAVTDNSGHVYVNLEDKNQLVKIDAKTLEVLENWPVAPGEKPSSLAIDKKMNRLFIGCRNSLLVIMDSENGDVIDSLPIGKIVDATAFDPTTYQVISSNGDGTLTIIKQDSADHYHIAKTIATPKGSKTFGLDTKTHKLFVPTAEFAPPATPGARPTAIAGTFKILVFEE